MPVSLRSDRANWLECQPYVTVADLCCDSRGCCGDVPSLEALDLAPWVDFQTNGTAVPPGTYTAAELELLEEAQQAIIDATELVDSRTCNRFRPGQCLTVRLCAPCDACPVCLDCDEPPCYDLGDLCEVLDFRWVSAAHMVSYDAAGVGTSSTVDLPNGAPLAASSWRIERIRGRLEMCPQRQLAADDLPELPEQNLSLRFGLPDTSALVIQMSERVPAEVRKAISEVACLYLDECHAGRCKKVPEEVESVTSDGRTYSFDRPTPAELQAGTTGMQGFDVAVVKWGCRPFAQWVDPSDPRSIVRTVTWSCECEIPA